jgi:hypothetical protein
VGHRNQTQCKYGHAYTIDNTYIGTNGYRRCRRCRCEGGAAVKSEVLAHYSPNGVLGCSWENCGITDSDVLTLDHINNDGADARKYTKIGSGSCSYWFLKKNGYPDGYQTLCWNHQWKKRISILKECHGK